uniref:Uncharacterized protein n=1 Tax=Setaria italica TaxID=4555 RepID=K4AMB9_SETIT
MGHRKPEAGIPSLPPPRRQRLRPSGKEQVLDRQDTHEEHRLLVAVKEVARQHERLGMCTIVSQ